MLVPAAATTEVFSCLLLLPLEIAGQWMPSQSLLILQTEHRFLVLKCEVEIDCTNACSDGYAHKVIRIALYKKKIMYFNSCYVCKVLLENVSLIISSLILHKNENTKKLLLLFSFCYTWSHQ